MIFKIIQNKGSQEEINAYIDDKANAFESILKNVKKVGEDDKAFKLRQMKAAFTIGYASAGRDYIDYILEEKKND